MKKMKGIGALSIGLAFLLAPGSAIRADAASDKLTVVVTDEPKSLDPCDTDLSGNSRILHNNITEALVNLSPAISTALGVPHDQLVQVAMGKVHLAPEQWTYLGRRFSIQEPQQ